MALVRRLGADLVPPAGLNPEGRERQRLHGRSEGYRDPRAIGNMLNMLNPMAAGCKTMLKTV